MPLTVQPWRSVIPYPVPHQKMYRERVLGYANNIISKGSHQGFHALRPFCSVSATLGRWANAPITYAGARIDSLADLL